MNFTLFGLSVAIGFVLSGFFLWRRAIDEHFSESEVFDVYIASALWALLVSRAVEVASRIDRFGLDPLRWLSLFSIPGLNGSAALVVAVVMILLAGWKRHWDLWITMDVYFPAIMLWQSAIIATFRWEIGVLWLVWFGLLWWIEREYRLWDWCKGKRGSTRPGIVASAWIAGEGVGLGIVALRSEAMISFGLIALALVLAAVLTGYHRSARTIQDDLARFVRLFSMGKRTRRKN